jgi:hypothetical protein
LLDAAYDGQRLRLTTSGGAVTLQNHILSTLETKLRLPAPRVELRVGQFADFVYADRMWTMTGHSGFALKLSGRAVIARGQGRTTVTLPQATSTSVIHATVQSEDDALTHVMRVIPGEGSFEIHGNALAGRDVAVAWTVEAG